MIPQQQVKNNKSKADCSVTVSIMDLAPVTILVPADLEVDDPAFIQHVAQEALTLYKRQIKGIDPTSGPSVQCLSPSITWQTSR